MEATKPQRPWTDLLAALAIACALSAVWTLRSWADLSALRLPDPDDMMRLQEIRDWLNGQAFADLTQYRLGAAGVPMHWSRLADLVPAPMIWGLQSVIGRHAAEVVAVVAWPAMLNAAAIALSGRIARLVGGLELSGPAMIIAAIAFPATTLFVPGRIDHHGLQVVLLLVTLLVLLSDGSVSAGLVGGIATLLSIVVGMELAPLLALAAAFAVGDWIIGRSGARARIAGLGISLLGGTLAASSLFRTLAWDFRACDGFTNISARAMLLAACLPIGLALLGTGSGKVRAAAALLGASALAAALAREAPQCLSPYGAVSPQLQQLWLSRVTEAQALFMAPAPVELAYSGLMVAGLAAGAWRVWLTRTRGWIVLLLLQTGAAVVTLLQVRGAYAGALLAAPALAAAVVAARRSGVLVLVVTWAASAGMLYPVAAEAITPVRADAMKASCTAPDLNAALGKLPKGTVMAPIDTAATAILSTDQRFIAGAYHRDGAGDLAMYDFFLGNAENAHAIAGRWHVRWVVACDGFGGVPAPFASQLERGRSPSWLRAVDHVESGARIFEVTG